MAGLINSFRALGPARLAALAAVAVLSLGLLAFLAFRNDAGPMALLYADLDLREAGQVIEQLDRARIPRQIEGGGSRVLVPADQVARARLLLAKDGLPSGGSIGYEIFDRTDGLTASGFQQAISQTRALEGELSRTIRMLQGVRAVRVHLVLPKREPFARERQDAQASVLLTMAGAARMDREGTQAVLNLVSAAVPGLRPQNIAVIDSRNGVLARAGQPVGIAGAVASAEEARRASELRLSRAVEEMLERTVGAGRVRAEATLDLDYDQVRETQEKFDPDGQVVRSQQSTTGSNRTSEAPNTVSVANNLPNADAGATQSGSQEQKQEETTNYEISKTVRILVREQPQLRRLSLAVMVDGVAARATDGTSSWTARSPEELAGITALVRSAVGFNEQRGDKVEVISMRFTQPDEGTDTSPAPLLGLFDRADLLRLGQTGFIGLIVLLALLLVFKPLVLRLTQATVPGVAGAAPRALNDRSDPALPGAPMADRNAPIQFPSINQISDLVDAHPNESAAVLRNWLLTDAGGAR